MYFWDDLQEQVRYLWDQFKSSGAIVKITVVTVAVIWVAACTTLMVALGFLLERPAVAQLPTPSLIITAPMISLEPTAGTVNTVVTVKGQGWTPGSTVLIYLAEPEAVEPGDFALNSTAVNSEGKFEVTAPILASQDWQIPGLVRVIARAGEGEGGAQAFFSLIEGTAQATGTSSPQPTATLTPPVEQSPTATATPQPGEPKLIAVTDLNIRSGPGVGYPVLGLLRANQSAKITGVSRDGRWWQIEFAGSSDDRGWVAAQYVTAQNTGDVPVVQAAPLPPTAAPAPTTSPLPTVTPVVITDWRGEYYNNPTMSGSPVLIRNDVDINYDWGKGSPAANMPADNFSARWTRSLYFPAGAYRFTVRADDGVLLWVDDRLIIDQWHDSSARIYTADVNLTDGLHSLKMAYYERASDAIAQLRWERLNTFPDWKGEYYGNPNLSGSPAVVRNDSAIDFNWGIGSPAAGIPADNFSVRWTRDIYFNAGTYRFTVKVDDGIRVWVDGNLVIDQWHDNDSATYVVEVNLPEGSRNVKVEYYDHGYDAIARLEWAQVTNYPDWKAEYYNNRRLEGNPVLVRNEAEIDHNWGTGSPSSEVPADNFSARWTRRVDFKDGVYLFRVRVDDGVRLWVDDDLIIDSWQDGSVRLLEREWGLSAGKHRLVVEYYERSSGARIELDWERLQQPANRPPQAVPGGPYNGNEGSKVALDGRESTDPDGKIVLYEWDLNYKGQNFQADRTGAVINHVFPDGPASIKIALRVTDNKGASHLATTQVNVQNVSPVADAGGSYSGRVGRPISLTGTGSDAGSIDQEQLLYNWDFGDGSAGRGRKITHSYAQVGTYNVTLTVTDKDGSRSTDTTTVQVNPAAQAPQAVIQGPAQGIKGERLGFSGSSSSDSDGTIVKYVWNFGDGTTAKGMEVNHTYKKSGNYKIKLVVTDNDGLTGTTTKSIQIDNTAPTNQPPTAAIAGPGQGLVGETLDFGGGGSGDSDGNIVGYAWDFGDGTTATGVNVTHTYSVSGTYEVELVVTDDDGATGAATKSIQISEPSNLTPTAVITGPTSGVLGETLTFNGSNSSDSDGVITGYSWNFGDGTIGGSAIITHTYTMTGTYQVVLTVTDDGGLSASAGQAVQINDGANPSVNPGGPGADPNLSE